MAAEQGSEDRSLEPSERKLQKAREEARFPQSRDLSFLVLLLVAALVLLLGGTRMLAAAARLLTEALRFNGRDDPLQHLARWASGPLIEFGLWLFALLGAALVAGALAPLALNKLQPVFALRFDLSRLDPVAGFARMFSTRNLFALLKGVVVTAIVIAAGAGFFLSQRDSLMLPPSASVAASVARLVELLSSGLWLLAGVVLLIAAADASFQWVTFRKEMRMSHQEVKDEMKESEGSPEIRARLRSMQRETSRRRMMAAVEKADVVVVNPTHFAVALRYDRERMEAPTVIAKGTDEVALRIREIARAHDVPLAESPLLARWLSANVEIDATVPPRLYAVIAHLLAWAYDTRAGGAGKSVWAPDIGAALDPP